MILHPVIARVSHDARGHLRGRAGVEEATRLGRAALERSSRSTRLELLEGEQLPRDAQRAPAPLARGGKTWHWSTTNTRGLVAAVVAPARVAIDAEWLDRPRLAAALDYLAEEERALLGLDERRGALALWSAKEAAVKLTGVGMAGMARTRLERGPERERASAPDRLIVSLDGVRFDVVQLWMGEHVLSVTCDAPAFRVAPSILPAFAVAARTST